MVRWKAPVIAGLAGAVVSAGGLFAGSAWLGQREVPGSLMPMSNAVALAAKPPRLVLRAAGWDVGSGRVSTITLASLSFAGAIGVSAVVLVAADPKRRARNTPAEPSDAQPVHGSRSAGEAECVPPGRTPVDRRTWFRRVAAGAAITIGWAVPARATLIAPWRISVRKYRIVIPDLPQGLDGLRIVQLSDTHLGPEVAESFVAEAVRMALLLKPDMVVLTGDYLSASPRYVEPCAEVFRPLADARVIGPIGVLGNHDWWEGGGGPVSRALERRGVRMIDNDAVYLRDDRTLSSEAPEPGLGIAIVGVGDLMSSDTDVPRAFARVPRGIPTILLSHEPDVAELGEFTSSDSPRVDVMLCGHTHGGQVRIPLLGAPFIPSAYGQKYAGGLVHGPAFPVLVSRGIGMSWLPVRWGVPPEVVELTLSRA